MDIREWVGCAMKTKNKNCWQPDERSGPERSGPPAQQHPVPLAAHAAGDAEEASAAGRACYSLRVIFLTNYACHCVKWWKAGGAGRHVRMEKMLFLLFLINNVAIIPYSQMHLIIFKCFWHSWSSCFILQGDTVAAWSLRLRQAWQDSSAWLLTCHSKQWWDGAKWWEGAAGHSEVMPATAEQQSHASSTHLLGQPEFQESHNKTRSETAWLQSWGAAWCCGDGLLYLVPACGLSVSGSSESSAPREQCSLQWPSLVSSESKSHGYPL